LDASAAFAPQPASEPGGSRTPAIALTCALFVLSGATGLIDQLCFSKYLTYIVGSTAYAVSAVLAAFMTGLAIGAHWGGKVSRRVQRPLLAYGVLELVVAAAVALTPLAFRALTPIYVSLARSLPTSLVTLSALRWLIALGLVVVPTLAMGASLPLLSRSFDTGEASDEATALRERRLGALYALNTLGGACGALSAAYLILPAVGVDGALFASAGGSAAIALLAIVFGWRRYAARLSEVAGAGGQVMPSREGRILLALAFTSGCLVFAAEVVFTHLLALIIGNSAYAFGLILAIFLACLCLGAERARSLQRRFGDAALPLGLAFSGLGLALSMPGWDKLPSFFENSALDLDSFAKREAVRGLAALAILFLPTTLMGLTFPLVLQRVARHADLGRSVGRLTAGNTLGAVFGALLSGYALLPWLGSQHSLLALALAFSAASLLVLSFAQAWRRYVVIVAAVLTGLLALFVQPWDLSRLTSGVNVYFGGYRRPDKILMVREDVHGGVTTVTNVQGLLTLYTNGKFQGNTGGEMAAQRFFAHYPSLFVDDFQDLLVIGLGTGTTLGTLAGYPWQKIAVAEISPSILFAARRYFGSANLGAIDDPRVTIQHADGRNLLMLQEKQYDLVSIELTSIWFAGAANLYNREFYQLVHQRLKPRGVLQQWVQMHHMSRRDLATVLNTSRREFRHAVLFYGGRQGILVTSNAPLLASRARTLALERTPRVAATIPGQRPLLDLLNDVLLTEAGLDRFIADTAAELGKPIDDLVSTDSNLYLEYATPRGNALQNTAIDHLLEILRPYQDPASAAALVGP